MTSSSNYESKLYIVLSHFHWYIKCKNSTKIHGSYSIKNYTFMDCGVVLNKSSIHNITSSFHHHISSCLSSPFIHPHTECSANAFYFSPSSWTYEPHSCQQPPYLQIPVSYCSFPLPNFQPFHSCDNLHANSLECKCWEYQCNLISTNIVYNTWIHHLTIISLLHASLYHGLVKKKFYQLRSASKVLVLQTPLESNWNQSIEHSLKQQNHQQIILMLHTSLQISVIQLFMHSWSNQSINLFRHTQTNHSW